MNTHRKERYNKVQFKAEKRAYNRRERKKEKKILYLLLALRDGKRCYIINILKLQRTFLQKYKSHKFATKY